MSFRKCDLCGELTEMVNENIIQCSNCNKLFNNNFNDWIKNNPGRSFEYYKSVVCEQEWDIKHYFKKKKILYIIGIFAIIVLLIFSLIYRYKSQEKWKENFRKIYEMSEQGERKL